MLGLCRVLDAILVQRLLGFALVPLRLVDLLLRVRLRVLTQFLRAVAEFPLLIG